MYFEFLDDAVTLHLRKTGKTQEELADEMGMAPNTFSWKWRGVREFTLSEVVKLSQIVGLESIDAALVAPDEPLTEVA